MRECHVKNVILEMPNCISRFLFAYVSFVIVCLCFSFQFSSCCRRFDKDGESHEMPVEMTKRGRQANAEIEGTRHACHEQVDSHRG